MPESTPNSPASESPNFQPSQFIRVDFTEPREVLVDGTTAGGTNGRISVASGSHIITLSGAQNYNLPPMPVSVLGTSPERPLILTATLAPVAAPPTPTPAPTRVALLTHDAGAQSAISDVLKELNVAVGFTGVSRGVTKTPLPADASACDLILFVDDSSEAKTLDATDVRRVFGTQRRAALISGDSVPDHLQPLFDFTDSYSTPERLKDLARRVARDFLIAEEVSASVAGASVHDRATDKDALGFEPYVAAVGEFLLNKDTLPPLTMSVEGSWGSGKSSFMLQLQKYLSERQAITISFNAWRHEKAEEMWAAFAIHFIEELKTKTHGWFGRLRRDLALMSSRFDWRRGAPDLIRVVFLLTAFAIVAVAVPVILAMVGPRYVVELLSRGSAPKDVGELAKGLFGSALGLSGVLAFLAAAVPLLRMLTKQLRNPLEIDLGKYVNKPDYESKVSFLERFHQDLHDVIKAYAPGRKILVFIDDLDRCEVPHAADLMQALNLMLSENEQLIFIMGIDREKVAAGLAVKHEKLLPYLSLDTAKKETINDKLQGIAFGYNFIEKFIQVPFVLPEPTETDIVKFLSPRTAAPATGEAPVSTASTTPQAANAPAPPPERTFVKLELGTDSANVIGIARMVASALDWNPRRIKQFVNLFRLRAMIAASTGLFDAAEKERQSRRLTLRKLGKFVALELRWPLLLAHFEQDPQLIADLEVIALHGHPARTDRAGYWSAQPGILSLLRSGCVDAAGQCDESSLLDCSLGTLDLARLLRVAPLKRGVAAAPPPPPPAPSAASTPVQAQATDSRLPIQAGPDAPLPNVPPPIDESLEGASERHPVA